MACRQRVSLARLGAIALCLWVVMVARPGLRAATLEPRPETQNAESAAVTAAQTVVDQTCRRCHNDRTRRGDVSLESFDVTTAADHAELAERMIRKLRAGMMPPAGVRRPAESLLEGLAELLETQSIRAATSGPRSTRTLDTARSSG